MSLLFGVVLRCFVGLVLLVGGFWWQGRAQPPSWVPKRTFPAYQNSHVRLERSTDAEEFVPPDLDAPLIAETGELDFEAWALPGKEACPAKAPEGLVEHFCKHDCKDDKDNCEDNYDADALSGRVLGILNLSHAELKTDIELKDVTLGKLEARGSKVSMLSIKHGTEIAEVIVGNATIDTLELEDAVRIGRLEISGSSLKSLELRNAVVRTLILRKSSIDAIVLERSTVEKLEMKSVSAKGSLEIEGSVVGDVDIQSSTFHEIEVGRDDNDHREPEVDKWTMRGVQATSIKVDSASVGTIDFDDVKATGRLKVEGTHVDKLEINASTLGRLALDGKKKTTSAQTAVNKLKLERSQVGVWEVSDATQVGNAKLSESKLETVVLQSSAYLDIDFEDSTVKRLELDGKTPALWKGGDISTFSGDVKVVNADLWDAFEFKRQAWTAFEKQLRDEGSNRAANALHVVRLKDESRKTAWTRERAFETPLLWVRAHLTLDAHGDPITYIAWLFGVVFVAAGVVFTNWKNGRQPPSCVLADPPPQAKRIFELTGPSGKKSTGEWVEKIAEQSVEKAEALAEKPKAAEEPSKDTPYSPFIMSLATLLPGDTFNYLRNFKFVPKDRAQALLMVAFQLLALTLQGLLIASIALLIGR